jgi:hypothetical protein
MRCIGILHALSSCRVYRVLSHQPITPVEADLTRPGRAVTAVTPCIMLPRCSYSRAHSSDYLTNGHAPLQGWRPAQPRRVTVSSSSLGWTIRHVFGDAREFCPMARRSTWVFVVVVCSGVMCLEKEHEDASWRSRRGSWQAKWSS